MFDVNNSIKESPIRGLLGMRGGIGIAVGASGFTIDRALRFNQPGAVLERTFGNGATSTTTGTFSWWIKRSAISSEQTIVVRDGTHWFAAFSTDSLAVRRSGSGFARFGNDGISLNVFRDPSAWYHFVVSVDNQVATAFCNGVRLTGPSQATDAIYTTGNDGFRIGSESATGASSNFEGLMAEFHHIDGQALQPTSFGEFDSNGVWTPIEYSGTYGNFGYYLKFDPDDANGLGADSSGNGNNWTPRLGDAITSGINTTPLGMRALQVFGNNSSTYDPTTTDRIFLNDGQFGPHRMFNGLADGEICKSGTGSAQTWIYYRPDPALTVSSSLGINASNTQAVRVNGVDQGLSNTSQSTMNVSSPPGIVTSIEVQGNSISSATVFGIIVDGTVLLDAFANDLNYKDTPSANYSTYNPRVENDSPTFDDAALDVTTFNNGIAWTYQELPNKRIFFEINNLPPNARFAAGVGIVTFNATGNYFERGSASDSDYDSMCVFSTFQGSNRIFNFNTTATQTGLTAPLNLLGIDYRGDLTPRTIRFHVDGNAIGSAENLPAGAPLYFLTSGAGGSTNVTGMNINSGQRDYISPPTGVTASSNGLKSSQMSTSSIKKGTDHCGVVTYMGNGAASLAVTGLDFEPDLVVLKSNSSTTNWQWFDQVRGIDRALESDNTNGQTEPDGTRLLSFNSNGFTVGNNTDVNDTDQLIVGYCWNAGGTSVTNTDGNVPGITTVRASQTSGFSIVTYNADGNERTVGHGLGAEPHVIIFKRSDGTASWPVYFKAGGNNRFMRLNSADGRGNAETLLANTTPNATTFTIGAGPNDVNSSGEKFIAYCWAPIEGYSKFGIYGTPSTQRDQYIDCGFRPQFVMVKRYTGGGGHWVVWDDEKPNNKFNQTDDYLFMNDTGGSPFNNGSGTTKAIDIYSNGFRIITTDSDITAANDDYCFMAFARNPFGGSGTTPARAR